MKKFKIKYFGVDLADKAQCFRLELELTADDFHHALEKATEFMASRGFSVRYEIEIEYLKPMVIKDYRPQA